MKIAILGNYSTQFFRKALQKLSINLIDKLEIYEGAFDSIDFEIIDPNSALFSFKPSFIIIHESEFQLRKLFYNLSDFERLRFAEARKQILENRIKLIGERLPTCKILYPSIYSFNDNIFGNYFSKVEQSWYFQIQCLNYEILKLSNANTHFCLLDSSFESFHLKIRDWTQVYTVDLHFSLEYLDDLAKKILNFLITLKGNFKKCLILDLDNTLWGGIIGDDGLDGILLGGKGLGNAYLNFQIWIKELQKRGIILAICSKNEESNAKMPFLKHPEMVLKLDDIAIFVANWSSKADNINYIKEVLSIGFDSMVFIDDNPAEREIVRSFLPEVSVPELPSDPSDYLGYLISLNLFETTSFSNNDLKRTKQYQEEAQRAVLLKSITNMDDYLDSLKMEAIVDRFSKVNKERIHQLFLRSNQFNLKTIRYSIEEIERMIDNQNLLTYSISLKDRFGDYGLISLVVIDLSGDGASIDSWIMSCRVLKRTVEYMLINLIKEELIEKGIKELKGEYIRSDKNELVSSLLPSLGFTEFASNKFILPLNENLPLKTQIKYEKNY
jgi:FkbH-like protein